MIATIFSCGIYLYFWLYNIMDDGNRHFMQNWAWEDSLAPGRAGGPGMSGAGRHERARKSTRC